jgi:hypothetical protein
MGCKVFVLGRPGSGKSAAVRHLIEFARRKEQSVVNLNDYNILYRMFLEDIGNKRFRPTEHGGFDVLDSLVRDEAQRKLEQEAQACYHLQENALTVLELGRPNYKQSFELFSNDFLQEAYYLFIAADYKTCLKRVQERLTHAVTRDDYFLAEHILSSRYSCPYVPSRIKGKKITIIENTGSLEEFCSKLEDFACQVLMPTLNDNMMMV